MCHTIPTASTRLRASCNAQGPTGQHRLHFPAKSAHATRERPRFAIGQRVWFVKGPGRALQPHPHHIGQYGRVDDMQFIGDSWVYVVRCRGKADTVDQCCLVANPV